MLQQPIHLLLIEKDQLYDPPPSFKLNGELLHRDWKKKRRAGSMKLEGESRLPEEDDSAYFKNLLRQTQLEIAESLRYLSTLAIFPPLTCGVGKTPWSKEERIHRRR